MAIEYYFETNALRGLNSELTKYSSKGFTSAWAIIELICGLSKSEKEFRIRRKIISNIINNNFNIKWKMPFGMISDSFTIKSNDDKLIHNLQMLCHILMQSDSFEIFTESCKVQELPINVEHFKLYKDTFSEKFISYTEETNVLLQKAFNHKVGEYDLINKEKFLNYYQKNGNNVELTVRSFAKLIAVTLYDEPISEHQIANIYNLYTGLVDAFMEAYSYYKIHKIIQGSSPQKSDLNDLFHLVYIKNSSIKLVSDDNLMHHFNTKIWSGDNRVISIKDIKNLKE